MKTEYKIILAMYNPSVVSKMTKKEKKELIKKHNAPVISVKHPKMPPFMW